MYSDRDLLQQDHVCVRDREEAQELRELLPEPAAVDGEESKVRLVHRAEAAGEVEGGVVLEEVGGGGS